MIDTVVLAVNAGHVWADTWRIVATLGILWVIVAWWYWLLKNFGTF